MTTRGIGARNRPRPKRSRPSDEQIAAKHSATCWLARFSDKPCSSWMELTHLIKKERLRFHGVPEDAIWDPRVLVEACDAHHHQLDDAPFDRIELPREALPLELEEYAAEHGMTWWLDRTYGRSNP